MPVTVDQKRELFDELLDAAERVTDSLFAEIGPLLERAVELGMNEATVNYLVSKTAEHADNMMRNEIRARRRRS